MNGIFLAKLSLVGAATFGLLSPAGALHAETPVLHAPTSAGAHTAGQITLR